MERVCTRRRRRSCSVASGIPTARTIDVVPGRGSGFALEAPEGVRFLIRSRLLTEDELESLDRSAQ